MTEEELISEESINEETEWEELKQDSDYEININYPHQIRKKSNGKILKETIMSCGYLKVSLNQRTLKKHRLIALQFIPNPDNLPFIDHINHIRTDNRIENLRWCSHIQNDNNKSKTGNGREIEYVIYIWRACWLGG